MKRLVLGLLCLLIFKGLAFSRAEEVKENAGNSFDTGCVYVSSMSVRRSGESTFSLTDAALTGTTYSKSTNDKWMLKNKGPYDVMVDSCIWSDKGTIELLGTEQPWLMEDEEKIWLNGKTKDKVYMRALTEVAGWCTMQYWITFDE